MEKDKRAMKETYGRIRGLWKLPNWRDCLRGGSESEVPQSCPTLRDPMNCSLPGSSVHGILQARILEWVAFSFSRRIFMTQGAKSGLLHCRQILYCLSHRGSLKRAWGHSNSSSVTHLKLGFPFRRVLLELDCWAKMQICFIVDCL